MTEVVGKQKKKDSNGSERETQNPSFGPIKLAPFSPFYKSYSLEIRWVIFNSHEIVLISKVFTVWLYVCEIETFDHI